jgi:hypothetical protein
VGLNNENLKKMSTLGYNPKKKISEPFKTFYKRQKKSERKEYDKIISELSYQHSTGVKTEILVIQGSGKVFIEGRIIYMDEDIVAIKGHLDIDRGDFQERVFEVEIKNVIYVPIIRL